MKGQVKSLLQTEKNKLLCKNCSTEFSGKFCTSCGQKEITGKLSFRELFTSVSDSFNLEKGFFKTFPELLLKPQVIIQNYLSGKRKCYSNPVKFFLIILAVNVFFQSVFQNDSNTRIEFINSPTWIVVNLLFLIPLISVFTKMLGREYNYLENIVINLYAFGVNIILSTILLFLTEFLSYINLASGFFYEISAYTIRIGFLTWFYSSVFKKSLPVSFLFSFFAYFTTFISLYLLVRFWLKLDF